jgi:hypothetical protein
MFAATPRHGFCLGNLDFFRCETGALVGTVAERLAFGLPAGTPEERSGFDSLKVGGFLGNRWFTHEIVISLTFGFCKQNDGPAAAPGSVGKVF